MASHSRCLLFRENGDFHGRVLARIGGLYKTQDAVNGKRVADNTVIMTGALKINWKRLSRCDCGS